MCSWRSTLSRGGGALQPANPEYFGSLSDLKYSGFGVVAYGRLRYWPRKARARLDRRFAAGPAMTYDDGSPKGLSLSPDGRMFTAQEWRDALPERPFQSVCG